MTGRERNKHRAHRWMAFMRAGGKRWPNGDMVRHHRSRYFREIGRTVYIYIAEVVR